MAATLSNGERRVPPFRHGRFAIPKLASLELALVDLLRQLDSANGDRRIVESFEPEHRPDPDGKSPIAAQPLNSTVIRCWQSKRLCAEYRAHIVGSALFPLDPFHYQIASWNDGKIIPMLELLAQAEMLLHIDVKSERVEMEYRREPIPGRSRVFERWVLE